MSREKAIQAALTEWSPAFADAPPYLLAHLEERMARAIAAYERALGGPSDKAAARAFADAVVKLTTDSRVGWQLRMVLDLQRDFPGWLEGEQ